MEGDVVPLQAIEASTEAKLGTDDVRHVTQEDLDSHKYSIYDVLLPMPGYSVKLPQSSIK